MEESVNRKEIQKRTLQVLQEVGLSKYADEWPGVLSGGQRQQVALARALISQTHLLLLDESLGALGALTRIGMQQLIERLWAGTKVYFSTVTHGHRSSAQTAALIGKIKVGC